MQTPPTVLVIDDERGPRESLRILLKHDYNVLCTESVDGGLSLLRQRGPDAIVMDIRMPGKSGITGLREIRDADPFVSVIMLTGFGTLETAQEAIRLGANDYIKKPFDAAEMQDVIRRNVQRTQFERRRARAEQELKKLNDQLLEELAQKEHFATLGQKSAELMHDLRNPLTAVLGYVELLSDELRNARQNMGDRWLETMEYIDATEKSVNRCKDLADMWLSLVRKDRGGASPVVACQLVQDIARDVEKRAAARGVTIALECEATQCLVDADAVQLGRALQNIVANALEAVSDGTGLIRIACTGDENSVTIRVEDNGCGMEPEQIGRLFEPYFTTKKATGTGLGLFITKKVIENHRGSIQLRSKVGEGTMVTVRLPVLKKADVVIA
jgi:signal transduction histidine kinase